MQCMVLCFTTVVFSGIFELNELALKTHVFTLLYFYKEQINLSFFDFFFFTNDNL